MENIYAIKFENVNANVAEKIFRIFTKYNAIIMINFDKVEMILIIDV